MSFAEFKYSLSPSLIQVITELGFTEFTPIQAKTIPLLLEGRDVVGHSQTGSGKTAAFALPILQKIDLKTKQIQALVLCPTRELGTQVAREIRKFGRQHPGLQVVLLSGGQPVRSQRDALARGVHIAVGTPGRLIDHLSRANLDLSHVSCVVLDEADRMLDMGFKDDMETVLKATPKARQTAFFSATFPPSIESMSRVYQKQPIRITVDEDRIPLDIEQWFYEVSFEEKFEALLWLLQKNNPESSLIFCNLKATVDKLTTFLLNNDVSAGCLHGDLEQSERDRVMAKFRNQSLRMLVATDVAARGIDVEKLEMVFNFDLPSPDVYVHRIGRTGRAGEKGKALSLFTSNETMKVDKIEAAMGSKIRRETLEVGRQVAPKRMSQDSKMETLFIAVGRKDKIRPGDILGALTGEAGGFSASDIGKIEIHDRFSYVALSKNVMALAMETLKTGRIKGRKVRVERVK